MVKWLWKVGIILELELVRDGVDDLVLDGVAIPVFDEERVPVLVSVLGFDGVPELDGVNDGDGVPVSVRDADGDAHGIVLVGHVPSSQVLSHL